MPKAKPGGYHFRQEIARAREANQLIRHAVRRLLEDRVSQQVMAGQLARIALAVGTNTDALTEIEHIAKNERGATK